MPESLNFEIDLTALTGNKTPSTEGSAFQMGTVPSPRTGHSFTTISSKRAILFGGVTLENRLEGVDNIFRQSCKDGRLNININKQPGSFISVAHWESKQEIRVQRPDWF